MIRCFVKPGEWDQQEFLLSVEESHHLLRVLRTIEGERLQVFDGNGRVAIAEVISTAGGRAQVRIIQQTRCAIAQPSVSITLIQALPKYPVLEGIIQKGTELGISSIIPIVTKRVVLHLHQQEATKKHDRWQRIAREAAKQCGSNWPIDIQPISSLKAVLPRLADFQLRIVASLDIRAKPIREVIRAYKNKIPKTIALIIGPEGDLTTQETDMLCSADAILANFGSLVLRVGTAAIFGMSILAYEFLDQKSIN